MRPDTRALTTPDARFGYPRAGDFPGEIVHDPSFETAGLPSVEVLDGDQGYIRYDDTRAGAHQPSAVCEDNQVPAGAWVREVLVVPNETAATMYQAEGTLGQAQKVKDEAVSRYTLQHTDRLILRPNKLLRPDGAKMANLLELDAEGYMIRPAFTPLPYFTGDQKPGQYDVWASPLKYEVVGVITEDGRLMSWQNSSSHGGGRGAQRLVDLSVVARVMETDKEYAMLRREMMDESLLGQLSVSAAARTYLEHFQGGQWRPTSEPNARSGEFQVLTPHELDEIGLLEDRAAGR